MSVYCSVTIVMGYVESPAIAVGRYGDPGDITICRGNNLKPYCAAGAEIQPAMKMVASKLPIVA